jgi:hypothetical protein
MKSIFRKVVLFIRTESILFANAQDASIILKKIDDVMYSPKDMTEKNTRVFID